jgi:hypothetical protein
LVWLFPYINDVKIIIIIIAKCWNNNSYNKKEFNCINEDSIAIAPAKFASFTGTEQN